MGPATVGPADRGTCDRETCDPPAVTGSDDGRGGSPLSDAVHGGNFGRVGPTERGTSLGGTVHVGPRLDGGWEVRAVLSAGDWGGGRKGQRGG